MEVFVTGIVGDGILFSEWESIFEQHAKSSKFSNKYGSYEAPISRMECCDESKTKYFVNAANGQEYGITLSSVDMEKMGAMMGSPAFKSLTEDMKMVSGPLSFVKPMPPSEPVATLLATMTVKDWDKWYAGFKEHSTSKNVAGLNLPVTRSEFCDDSKTKVFHKGNDVCMVLGDVKMDVMGSIMGDPEFQKLTDALGEIAETKSISVLEAAPAPAPAP